MRTQLRSRVLWFAFVTFVICPAVQARDHEIEIYTGGGKFNYNHKKGQGVRGYVFVKKGHTVQWSCEKGDLQCDAITITFTAASPCTSSNLVKQSLAYCDGIAVQGGSTCVKGGKSKTCFPYTTKVYYMGSEQSLTEDPEFIVDDSKVDLSIPGGVGILTLLLGVAAGYRWGKTQGHSPTP